jgi:hypothetical protein
MEVSLTGGEFENGKVTALFMMPYMDALRKHASTDIFLVKIKSTSVGSVENVSVASKRSE